MVGRTERGEIGLRLVIVMALLAGLAWAVPMVLLGRQATDNAATLTGTDQRSQDARDSGQAPVAPIDKANDVQAQADLNNAIRVAQVYYAENGSYAGFGPQAAAEFDPTVRLTAGPPSSGVISVRGIGATTVVLVSAAGTGAYLCAAANAEVVTFGRTNATSAAQCTGGW